MTASHITPGVRQIGGVFEQDRVRSSSTNESARAPEQDFRETFQRHLNESSDAPRVKPVIEGNAPLVRAKEMLPNKPVAVMATNFGPQAAPVKSSLEKLTHAPAAAPPVVHSTASGAKQQAPSASGQQRKTKDPVETEPEEEQPASIALSQSEQPPAATGREVENQPDTADEYVATIGSSDEEQAITQAVNAAVPVSGDLAIAMRIDSAGNAKGEAARGADLLSPASASNGVATLLRGSPSSVSIENVQRRESSVSAMTGLAGASEGETAVQAEKGEPVAANGGTNPTDFEAEFAKFRSEPVRGAHVQIDGSNNERVDIRLLERGGALSVSVRSGDVALTRALQDHSTELNARLTTEHFRTELWTPDPGKQALGRTFEDGRGQSQGGSSGEDAPDQRQQRRQSNEPAWIEDFENHATAFQKRIEYTWHQ